MVIQVKVTFRDWLSVLVWISITSEESFTLVFLTPLKNIFKKLVDVDEMDFQHLPQYIITRMT